MAKSGVHGMISRDDPSAIYLLSDDIIKLLREHTARFEALIAKAKGGAVTEEGAMQIAALIGASAVLESVGQQLELLCIELATDADEILDKEAHSG